MNNRVSGLNYEVAVSEIVRTLNENTTSQDKQVEEIRQRKEVKRNKLNRLVIIPRRQ